MTIEINVNKDIITNIAGLIGAIALGVQPVIDGSHGVFSVNDASKLVLAITVAVIGWYTGKQPNGDKIPKGENLATTPVNPPPIV